MTIYLAADHAGYELKNALVAYLRDELSYTVEDCGAHEYDEADDYPPIIKRAIEAVSQNPDTDRAIILGGSGQGEAMVANRTPNIRAAVYYGGLVEIVRLSRAHNDANVLSLGARFITEADAKETVRMWLTTDFSGDKRHIRRLALFNERSPESE